MKNKTKQNEGITLVALAVTVIVLLILGGTAISLIIGEEGLFAKATVGKSEYNQKTKDEAERIHNLLEYTVEIPKLTNGNVTFTATPDTNINPNIYGSGVMITIEENTNSGFQLQYSMDEGKTFNNYTAPIEVVKYEQVILARLFDTLTQVEGNSTATFTVTNIDILPPNEFNLIVEPGDTSIKVSADRIIKDAEATSNSGSSGILKCEYKLNNGSWVTPNILTNTSYIFRRVEPDKEYTVSMRVTDKAGNIREATNSNYTVNTLEEKVTITVSDQYGNNGYSYAIDDNTTTAWGTASGNHGQHWYKIEFNSPKIIGAYYFLGAMTGGKNYGTPYKFYMQASNDDNNWVNIEGDYVHSGSVDYDMNIYKEYKGLLFNNTAYKYYRIYFPQGGWTYGSSGGGAIRELKLYEYIGDNPIQTMESVKISVSDAHAYAPYDNAVDGDINTGWSTDSGNHGQHWYMVEFDSPKVIEKYYLLGARSTGTQYKFYMQASNNGNDWVNLEANTVHDGVGGNVSKEYDVNVDNNTPYKFYRIYFPQGGWTWGSSGGAAIHELRMYEKNTSGEFEEVMLYPKWDTLSEDYCLVNLSN